MIEPSLNRPKIEQCSDKFGQKIVLNFILAKKNAGFFFAMRLTFQNYAKLCGLS